MNLRRIAAVVDQLLGSLPGLSVGVAAHMMLPARSVASMISVGGATVPLPLATRRKCRSPRQVSTWGPHLADALSKALVDLSVASIYVSEISSASTIVATLIGLNGSYLS